MSGHQGGALRNWDRGRSCGRRRARWPAQGVVQAEYAGEDLSGQRRRSHLEDGAAAVAHEAGAGLDEPFG